MPIVYSVVARGTVILADYAARQGNFASLTKKLLEKIPASNGRQTYTFESHYIHYLVLDGIVYLCISDENFSRQLAFTFLDEAKNRFVSTYPKASSAIAYAYQTDFSRVMKQLMDYYSNDSNADRIKRVQTQIAEVKDVMVDNIDKVLARGERIELLVDKTTELSSSALSFQKKSVSLKRSMWWKNIKIMIVIGVLVVLLIYIIAAIACKSPIFQGCWAQPSEAAPVAAPVQPARAPTADPPVAQVAPTSAPV